jgi:hypothetical protein
MPPSNKSRPLGTKPVIRPTKTLSLREVTVDQAAAARRPRVPTHTTSATNHARQHMPRNGQS